MISCIFHTVKPTKFCSFSGLLVIGLLSFFGAGCTTAEKKKTFDEKVVYEAPKPEPGKVQITEEKALTDPQYRAMQEAFRKAQYGQVNELAKVYERTQRTSPYLSYVRNLSGLSFLAQKKFLPAVAQFQRALDYNQNETIKPYLLYNLAASLTEAGQPDDSIETLKEVSPDRLNVDTRAKFYSLQAKNLLQKDRWVESARSTLQASIILGPQAGARPALVEQLDRALSQVQKQDEIAAILAGLEKAPIADRVQARLAPGLNLNAPALSSQGNSRAIGALLPLSGKFGEYGSRALRAITLAMKFFEAQGLDVTLHVEDSGETVEQAIRALNKLANKRQVSVVIGPLLSKGIDQITARAEVLGLPLVTLAQQTGSKGENVISAGLTPVLQAHEIAKYAIEKLGLKKFAILHPRNSFGEQYSQSYWDAVESLGGEVVGVESYAPGETDFRAAIDRLTGLAYPEARQREIDALAKQREELKITKKNRKTVQYYDLKPIVEFDAVFIPDEPKVVSMILPTFAYRDVDHVKFLGIATWNNPELVQRAAQYAEGAAFVDALYLNSANPVTQRFIVDYTRDLNENPTSIEAMAYDAGLVVEKALSELSAGMVDRSKVRERLQGIRGLQGSTGKISYRDGLMGRTLTLLTVSGGKIVEVK